MRRGGGRQGAGRDSRAGVTLMELLIAVTLLSLLSVGLLFALRIGMTAYSRTQARLMDNRRVMGAQRILEQELEGMIPVVSNCMEARTAFFQGSSQSMRLVSSFSLQGAWRGRPQVLEIFVAPGSDGSGVRLLVNETPYTGPAAMGKLCGGGGAFGPSVGPNSFVLADKLAYCRFNYLARPKDMMMAAIWSPQFGSQTWPQAVRIEMAPSQPDRGRLQPISTVAPLRIYRAAEVVYVDQ